MPPERQRILVIGGKGFLGSRIAAALRQIEGAEVVVSSRRGGGEVVACDIEDSSSRPAMAGFDVVVNCADGLRAAPEKAAEFCLLSGATFIETTADAVVMERLWETARKVPDPQGTLVLGAGLFPGLSNLLAADLVARHGVPERLEVGVRYCPWSVAGAGVCDLMVEAASRPAVRYEAGERVEDPPVTVAGSFPFSGVQRNALGVGLPEALMLHWSIGVPSARQRAGASAGPAGGGAAVAYPARAVAVAALDAAALADREATLAAARRLAALASRWRRAECGRRARCGGRPRAAGVAARR